jgi:hypothetical protein
LSPSRFGPVSGKVRRSLRHPIEELGAATVIGVIVGFAAGAGLILILHLANALPGGGKRVVSPFSEVSDSTAAPLAARFRPWLLFDSAERWRPLNVDGLTDEGTHQFCRGAGSTRCTRVGNHVTFDNFVAQTSELGAHLNLAGRGVAQYHGPEKCTAPQLDCGAGPRSAIYYHVAQSYDRFYIDYWWFLRDNHVGISRSLCFSTDLQKAGVCDEHEGDWEGVTVVTPPGDDNHVAYVVYAAHKGTFRYAATALQMVGENKTRPVVYLADGSHAAYPLACKKEPCFQPTALAAAGLFNVPEGRYDGRASWPRNPDAQCNPTGAGSCLLSLRGQPWTNWPGLWGDGCERACGGTGNVNSPQSPGLQGRFQTPWCSTETVGVTCDGRVVTCSDWLGPLVQAAICDSKKLTTGLRSSSQIAAPRLSLLVGGKQLTQPTTPGVVQALGAPFKPGSSFSAIADGPDSEILVRAEDKGITVEARFAKLGLKTGQQIKVTISRGTHGPTVLAGNRTPLEQRIIQVAG